jgi:hypothetical protein
MRQARFGEGWAISTDKLAGGKSVAAMTIKPGGAEGSNKIACNRGGVTGIRIQSSAKGDAETYRVMVFAKRLGFRPETQTFVAGPDCKQFTVPFTNSVG